MAQPSNDEIRNSLEKYKHKVDGTVKFAEVDSFGVMHNVQYHFILEWARIKYIQDLGIKMNYKTFTKELPMMVVHVDIDYFNAARFLDEYIVHSRVTAIKNSSISFDHFIELKGSGDILVRSSCIFVNLNDKNLKPERVSDELRSMIRSFEGDNVIISE